MLRIVVPNRLSGVLVLAIDCYLAIIILFLIMTTEYAAAMRTGRYDLKKKETGGLLEGSRMEH